MQRILRDSVFFLILAPALLSAEGFSALSPKKMTIQRMMPPTVNLSKKRIKIEARVEKSVHGADTLPDLLKTKLVTLIQNDPRFIIEEVSPETILKFTVTNYYTEKWSVGSEKDKHDEYRGKVEVAYQAESAKTRAPLDSQNLVKSIGYDAPVAGKILGVSNPLTAKKQTGRASEIQVRDDLVDGIVFEMGKRVAPVEEPEEVLLPGGKLEPLSSMALSNRWASVQEQAEKMDKFPKPLDDTYRLYLIALAEEVQSYALTREASERDLGKRPDISKAEADAQFKHAQQFMDEARKLYQEIVDTNPKEKGFRPGDTRTEEAMTIYGTIVRYQEELKKAEPVPAPAVQRSASVPAVQAVPAPTKATPVAVVSPLDRVLDFCRKGVDAASTADYIKSKDFMDDAKASKYKFNFGTDTLALTDACKASAPTLQKLIRDRLAPAPARAPAVPSGASGAASKAAAPKSRETFPHPGRSHRRSDHVHAAHFRAG